MATKESLVKDIKNALAGRKLIIASNREPYVHEKRGGGIECSKTVSGLSIALDPVMRAVGGTWIAWGAGDADRRTVDENNIVKVPPGSEEYSLKRLWYTDEERDDFYYGYSNQALWPLCHIAYEKPLFLKKHWAAYKKINKRFADAVIEESRGEDVVIWIQDYHLCLLPLYVKKELPNAVIAMMWHIPWPNAEVFRVCPQKHQILSGMLACDILGFHIYYHCLNFIQTVELHMEAKISHEESSISYKGHKTLVKNFPISVDFEGMSEDAETEKVSGAMESILNGIKAGSSILAVSVDRIDYTKGILERFSAIDRFFQLEPGYIGKIVFYQLGALSRAKIPSYKRLIEESKRRADELNEKYGREDWKPVVLNYEGLNYAQHLALYRCADLCIVSSLHDGMNLVAKEYVASRTDESGVLVLSRFTGSAREFAKGAVLFNPYDFDAAAKAIKKAVQMTQEEKEKRMKYMRSAINNRNIYRWAEKFITRLSRV
ncbi:MAG: trehalose-6-phosphate synthase [Candidatus Omnitrophica bacterium]|nr:trehalose-6-phosphate synthase [Candidatus Omnitrophota bacterium]